MKIVFIGGFRFPFGDAVAARYRILTENLVKLGHEVTVISQLPFKPRTEDIGQDNRYWFGGVCYYSSFCAETIQRSYLRSVTNITRAVRTSTSILQRLIDAEGVDIIFFQGNFSFYAIPVMRIAKRNNIPVLNETMEWFSPFVFYGGVVHPLAWDHEWFMRVVNKRFDGLIVISELLRSYYAGAGRNALLVPSLFKFSDDLPAPPAQGKLTFGYFGRPTQKDGIYDLLAALRILAVKEIDFEFLLAGDDDRPGNIGRVRGMVLADPLLSGRVKLLGKVPQERLPETFSNCSALVLSRPDARFSRAGVPQKLSEYMALGRAVVVSGVGDIPRYVRNGVDGFVVPPGDNQAFAEALEKIAKLPDLGAAMGMSAWHRGRDVFDVRVHAPRIVNYLERLVAEKKRNSKAN